MLSLFVMLSLWVLINLFKDLKIYVNVSFIINMIVWCFLCIKVGFSGVSSCSFFTTVSNMSVFFVILSLWVCGMMYLVSLKYEYYKDSVFLFTNLVSILLFFIVFFFLTDNFIVLYICFEGSLLPTLGLIMKWGYQPERLQSSFYFVMYTLCASLPLLLVLLYTGFVVFSFSMLSSFPMWCLANVVNSYFYYSAFMFAFFVKIPMWGVHLWLPKAHVEAPVSGSMILAGVLLKLGGYGLIKILSLVYKLVCDIKYFFYSVNLWGALLVGVICLCCVDIKSLIAYSSVVHMNLMVLGIMSDSFIGILGSVVMMIAHGVSSPGLFVMANLNYIKVGSRNVLLQKGLSSIQPAFSMMWFVLLAANMAAPPSINLVSEIFIYVSVLKVGFFLFFILGLISFISGAYNLFLYSCQQGNLGLFVCPSKSFKSNDFLVGLCHCLPVYLLVLCFFFMF